jgi:hypothetical protein
MISKRPSMWSFNAQGARLAMGTLCRNRAEGIRTGIEAAQKSRIWHIRASLSRLSIWFGTWIAPPALDFPILGRCRSMLFTGHRKMHE